MRTIKEVSAVPLTEAEKRAVKKYHAKFDELKLRVPAGEGAAIKAHAGARGETTNEFIKRAVNETMKRDQESSEQA